MHRRVALICLSLSAPLSLIAVLIGGSGAALAFATATAVIVPALALVGAAGSDGRVSGRLAAGLLALTGWLLACVASLAWLCSAGSETAATARLGGMPLAMAIQVYGLFLLPTPFVVWLYASTFDRDGISESKLAALRERFPSAARNTDDDTSRTA